ncbi:MAG: PAS domain S-box protein [Sterolibacterium sp.]|nr:PAS domain S-box protein [Sterolibacterium sp.]
MSSNYSKRFALANRFWFHSLKAKIVFFTLVIFLAGIWSLAFYVSQMLREDMQHLLSNQQSSTVSFMAAKVNDQLDERLKALEEVAKQLNPAILGDPAALQALLEQRSILQLLFNAGIVVTNLDGSALADIPLSSERIGVNYLDREHIASALRKGKAMIGRPIMGKKARAPIIGMAVPIRDTQGKVIGALAGVINLDKPNFLDGITLNNSGKTGGYLLVVPQYRLIVTAADKSRIMEQLPGPGVSPWIDRVFQGHEGTDIFVNPLGVEVLTSVKGVPVAGWVMVVALPTAEAFAPIRAMQQRMLLVTLLMTLLAGGLTWWMLRRQLSPMLVAAKTLATMSDNNLPLRPLPITGQDEIGEFIGGFNRLMETLGQREEALKESETRYRLLADNISDVLWVLNLEQKRWVYVSPSVKRLLGYSVEEVLAQPVEHTTTAASNVNLKTWIAERSRLFSIGAAGSHEYLDEVEHTRKDGSTVWTEMATRYIRNEQGELSLLGVSRDIGKRKRVEATLRESEARFRHIFEHNDSVMLLISPDSGEIVDANAAAAHFYGYPVERMRTMRIEQINTLLPEKVSGGLAQAGHHEKNLFIFPHRLASGEVRTVEVRSSPIEVGGSILLFTIVNDVTEREKTTVELKRSNAELEQFSYAVSHDMRQPLRMISSYLQLLGMELADQLDGEKREYFDFAIDGAKRLDRMLVALLEYSRVGRLGEPPVWVESRSLLEDVLLILQPEVAEAQARFSVTGNWPRVCVSRDEILRLMQNLIGNALKFRVTGRTPEIAIASEATDKTWRMSVADNGVGIIPDQIGRLFHVFQRLQPRAAYEGTGVGLALCRKIAERHSGRIWVESSGEGQGSTFRVELPIAYLATEAGKPTNHE